MSVSAAFLPKDKLVVYTEGRTRNARMKLYAQPNYYLRRGNRDYLADLPQETKSAAMVVLVNGGSASASEIVAGALQDHKRAVIMGTQTFGKGSVQTILPMGNETAIKLTTARYFTPNGRSIQAKGITPDIVVEEATIQEGESGNSLREADLTGALENEESEVKNKDDDVPMENASISIVSKDDYQLNQAINLLKGLQIIQAN